MQQIVNIFVNGEAHEIPAGKSVAGLLELLNISSERVAVELNKQIVRKRHWAETLVGNEARIEVVEFVGGG